MPAWRSDCFFFFFFNDTATTEIYTLSLHDALPISARHPRPCDPDVGGLHLGADLRDRKSTRLNSSHPSISYAVFCLKKKKQNRHLFFKPKKKTNYNKKRNNQQQT